MQCGVKIAQVLSLGMDLSQPQVWNANNVQCSDKFINYLNQGKGCVLHFPVERGLISERKASYSPSNPPRIGRLSLSAQIRNRR